MFHNGKDPFFLFSYIFYNANYAVSNNTLKPSRIATRNICFIELIICIQFKPYTGPFMFVKAAQSCFRPSFAIARARVSSVWAAAFC